MAVAGYYGPEAMLYATNGDPARNVPVEVLLAATGELATVYTDSTADVPAPNPVRTDALGNLSFFALPGFYLLRLVGTTQTYTVYVAGDTAGGGASTLDELSDVAGTAGAEPGTVLRKGDDGIWRPSTVTGGQRGDAIWFRPAPPESAATHEINDVWVNTAADFEVFQVEEA